MSLTKLCRIQQNKFVRFQNIYTLSGRLFFWVKGHKERSVHFLVNIFVAIEQKRFPTL